jgi:ketol-acid reductoisomerase
MAARIYSDKDADLTWLKKRRCAIISFGAQGRADALNLRDSGVGVIVGLYRESKSRPRARRNRLKVLETPEAVRMSDIIFLALPDPKMPAVYQNEIAPNLRPEQALLFAHGLRYFLSHDRPPKRSAELAYFECLHELKFIVDLIHDAGLSGMRTLISETKMGRIDGRPEDHRRQRAQTDGKGAARNSLRQVRARIYWRNENWPETLRETTARGRSPSHRVGGPPITAPHDLENKKQLAAVAARAATFL